MGSLWNVNPLEETISAEARLGSSREHYLSRNIISSFSKYSQFVLIHCLTRF